MYVLHAYCRCVVTFSVFLGLIHCYIFPYLADKISMRDMRLTSHSNKTYPPTRPSALSLAAKCDARKDSVTLKRMTIASTPGPGPVVRVQIDPERLSQIG